ncbi:nitrogen fixation protein NifQ [Azoarcus communis]|uniref:Nitrogen fixation protein NifQ n=1 Tax=Parazoarcus communis SWub3 = DSM 12120 TaxID=1121029 RepID=A0A323UY62_9RHOO|nr:nitrogen fixation protein NifQ [Parazoarcus communis]NMG49362.1 nitrogen fixation protein NifQ [Parazoarcus communis]NMG69440.1 nitrogen fixation protein NifQ [Parazoarcus communis SWub3 = DSM 12120]PZA17385.1 nitrogen fixation protein NifQ [Azoarcus communis] [Parazoarcus communis SWub3 = DSM 12120]
MLAPLSFRPSPARAALHDHLMQHAAGTSNDEFLAHLISGWTLGEGMLPADFGLGAEGFGALIARHFPGLVWRPKADLAEVPTLHPEFEDLRRFLAEEADPSVDGSGEFACIVATACMGDDHLWQDLGLPTRRELSQLIALNFPALAEANNRDMKWKKFLYRELCQREGIYVCASPSCEACTDYAVCFGPEV